MLESATHESERVERRIYTESGCTVSFDHNLFHLGHDVIGSNGEFGRAIGIGS